MSAATMPKMGYFKDTAGTEYHLANDWPSMAMCGSRPYLEQIGWTAGVPYGSFVAGDIEVCPECQGAYREFAQSIAAINADRR